MGKQNSYGFSLIELIAVFSVVGILLLIAVPNVSKFSSVYRLKGAVQEVATDLQFARLLAVKENKDIRVTFSSNFYQVVRVNDGNVVKSRSFLADYPDVDLSNVSVTFDSRGTFDPSKNGGASNATISVSNSVKMKNVSISRTGRVKIG